MVTVSVPSAVSSQTFTVLVNGVAQTTLTGSQVYGPIALEGQELLTVTGGTVYAGQSVLVAGEVRFVGVGEANPPPNVYNVVEYGADPTGVNDSAAAINNAIFDCNRNGGGTVWGVGTFYLGSGPVYPLSNVTLRGGGEGSTTFTANGALTGGNADLIRVSQSSNYYSNIKISGITLDCTNQTAGNGATLQGVNGLELEDIVVIESYDYGIDWGSVGGNPPYITKPVAKKIYAYGCGRSGSDSFGGGGITNGLIDGYWCGDSSSGTHPGGSGWDHTMLNGFKITNAFFATSGSPAAGALASDFGAVGLTIKDVWVDGWQYAALLGSTASDVPSDLTIDGLHCVSVSSAGVNFGFAVGYAVQRFRIVNCDFTSWGSNPALSLDGGHHGVVANNTFAANSTAYAIRLRGDGGSTSSNAPTDIEVFGNDVSLPTYGIYPQYVGAGVSIHDNPGYNPVGPVTVAVPASGTATAALPYDATFYITQTVAASSVAVQGQSITIPIGGPTAIRVPAGQTLTPTYSTAPTWVVMGE